MLERIYLFWGVNMKNKIIKILFITLAVVLILLLLLFPSVGRKGAADGLVLCGGVVIPSLFPFTFFVLMLMRSGIENHLTKLDAVTKKLLHLNGIQFSVFLLSLIGGYPIGAKLTDELYNTQKADRKTARSMLCCSVNSGPGFTVLFVGIAILNSKSAGFCLLAANIISSFILLMIQRRNFSYSNTSITQRKARTSISENFINSAADAASSMFTICAFVILFSSVNAYIINFSALRNLAFFTEITGALTYTKNIYFIAFLLGFAGVSVWLQVISITKNIGINLPQFILFRILHGAICAGITAILIKVFKISISTFNNGISFDKHIFYSSAAIGIALLIMVLLLPISLFGRKHSGNLLQDVL